MEACSWYHAIVPSDSKTSTVRGRTAPPLDAEKHLEGIEYKCLHREISYLEHDT